MERGEALHFNLRTKTALGIAVPVLLGSALAAGVVSLPAHAQSYQDTALSAGTVSDEAFTGSSLTAANGTNVIDLSGTNVTWSLHGTVPAGVSLTGGSTIACSSCTATPSAEIVADATDGSGNAEALELDVVITASTIQLSSPSTAPVKVTVTDLVDTNNSDGTVSFSATSSESNSITVTESNLPTGLTSGNPLTYSGGTAAPNTYTGVKATATDSDGAVLNGTFTLTVAANTVSSSTNIGDYVNKFGNGFDSYRQHDYAGAIIAGWPATQSDPATSFILNNGTHSGAVQIEYAPNGSASGLCVSDPGGGWGSDPLRDGLILTSCNTGPWQQFIPQSDGTLKNLATGLYVNPDGKGAQLRGESSPTSWGGSSYTWTTEGSLPG
jgi:hypothetical protein